jgi:hypothetical protein
MEIEPSTNPSGFVRWAIEKKAAVIRILKADDYESSVSIPQDMERSVVHELLHLHFATVSPDEHPLAQIAQEQAINAIAQTLVDLKRGGQPPNG